MTYFEWVWEGGPRRQLILLKVPVCLWLDKETSPWLMSPSWSAQWEAF